MNGRGRRPLERECIPKQPRHAWKTKGTNNGDLSKKENKSNKERDVFLLSMEFLNCHCSDFNFKIRNLVIFRCGVSGGGSVSRTNRLMLC